MKISIKSLNYSAILTVVLIVVLTIWSELSQPFKSILTDITGHHWVTKSSFSLIFFVLSYFILVNLLKEESRNLKKEVILVIIITILGALAIFGFYVWHFTVG